MFIWGYDNLIESNQKIMNINSKSKKVNGWNWKKKHKKGLNWKKIRRCNKKGGWPSGSALKPPHTTLCLAWV